MLLTNLSKYNVVVIINVIFTIFFDCDYELRRFKTNRRLISSVFIALKHRFLKKKRDNVTSVFYILNKANISLTFYFFDIIRLNLT